MRRRLFTPPEANQTLPLVRRIVADILEKGRQLRDQAAAVETPPARQRLQELQEEIEGHMSELEDIGCSYKDWGFDVGLIDFPAIIHGRAVLLCWRSDEEEVTWYHEPEAGYAGRTPIPGELLVVEEPAPLSSDRSGDE